MIDRGIAMDHDGYLVSTSFVEWLD